MKLHKETEKTQTPKIMPGWVQLGVIGLIGYILYADFSAREKQVQALRDEAFSTQIVAMTLEHSTCNIVENTPDQPCPLQLIATNQHGEHAVFVLPAGEDVLLPNGIVIRANLAAPTTTVAK